MAKASSSTKKPAPAKVSPGAAPKATSVPPANSSIHEIKPSADQIRQRAYHIYVERLAKGGTGDPQSDWLRAERELSNGQR